MVRRAVLPVAGLGTRFLPVTKSVPKELLPIVDKPAIQYIVEECVAAGIDDVLFVTSAGKSALEDHFDRSLALESALQEKGKLDDLAMVREVAGLADVHCIRQGEALGLGHAVRMGASHVGADESFAVILGDDLLAPGSGFLGRMIEAHHRTSRPVVALMEVPPDEVHRYGVAEVTATARPDEFEVTGVVEKPDPADAPSNLILVGRYVLPGSIFAVLDETPPGHGGEIQLTDALQTLADDEPLTGLLLDSPRYDTGDKLGYLKANLEVAATRDDLAPSLLPWLRSWLDEQEARAGSTGQDDPR